MIIGMIEKARADLTCLYFGELYLLPKKGEESLNLCFVDIDP
jgi:hypothetical protein